MAKTKNKNTNSPENKQRHEKTIISRINCIFFGLIIASSVYYIFGVNDLSIKGFKIYDLKAKLSELYEVRENFETKVMLLESYNHIVKKAEEMNLVKVDKIDYITTVNGVAIRD